MDNNKTTVICTKLCTDNHQHEHVIEPSILSPVLFKEKVREKSGNEASTTAHRAVVYDE